MTEQPRKHFAFPGPRDGYLSLERRPLRNETDIRIYAAMALAVLFIVVFLTLMGLL